jgi:hypothetical protein
VPLKMIIFEGGLSSSVAIIDENGQHLRIHIMYTYVGMNGYETSLIIMNGITINNIVVIVLRLTSIIFFWGAID